MFSTYKILYIFLYIIPHVLCSFPNIYPKIKQQILNDDEDPGERLILTPYLEENRIEEARNASLVTLPGFDNIESYSGFFTVDKTYNSNLFFWFFPSQSDYTTDPVLIWLQGGPGASGLIALFTENGPILVDENHEVNLREYSWAQEHSVIFVDSPVGTGFSFTDEGGYAQNQTKVGEDLYRLLLQFFTLFPEIRENEFYITGESYAGKYVPALGHTILEYNRGDAEFNINLQGIAIGNGLTDPVNQLVYDEYLYQVGIIDESVRYVMKVYQDQIVRLINSGEYTRATNLFNELILGGWQDSTIFSDATGFESYYNYLFDVDPLNANFSYYQAYLQRADVRAALHVGNTTYSGGDEVENNLKDDIMQSVAPWVSELLSNYRVLIYNGQLDIICAYPLTVNYLQNLNFSAANEYKSAPRYQWYVDDELAGYVKEAGNLTEVLVRDSGHMVPADQPKWAFDLISRFTRNKPFHSEKKRG